MMITRMIAHEDATAFILPRHYSGRKPQIIKAFGWFDGDDMLAACTFGRPASNSLCDGICGKEWSSSVYELNRLCREEWLREPLSSFVAGCLRALKPENWIIVSYSDTAMGHHGYVYQATNFLYTGSTRERTDKYTEGNRHSRHYDKDRQSGLRKVRSSKHRYVYFCTSDRRLRRKWRKALRYEVVPYPKGDNRDYRLGDFLAPCIVDDDGNRQETPDTNDCLIW
jgi:hypothetical protein